MKNSVRWSIGGIMKFNKDYYENGITKGVSGYENFRYIPTRSYDEALSLSNFIWITKDESILDLGCAKGFLVHALRQLGYSAYGEDISEYAINNCHPSVKEYVSLPTDKVYDTIICKDMMEHIPEDKVLDTLKTIRSRCSDALFVIPLGDNDKFRIREYEIDVTHVTKKDEDWWIDKLREAGFELDSFTYNLGDIKRKWVKKYRQGNGFFEVTS